MGIIKEVLTRVSACAAADELPVVVLDLDSTLFHTGERHLHILRQFAEQGGHGRLGELAAQLTGADFGWGVDGPLRARGFDDATVLADLMTYWRGWFFRSETVVLDRPAPGAVAFVRSVTEAGGLVYYLTARPAPTMGEGTVQALMSAGFPVLRGRAVLHLKPSEHLSDHRFKGAAITEIRSLRGRVVCTADNEPAHANAFRRAFPVATHLLFGTVRSPGAPAPHSDLVCISDFHR